MALGQTGRPVARLVAGVWLVFVCMVLCAPGKAVAAPGDYVESFGPDGTSGTEFDLPSPIAVDQESGAVYVGDTEAQILYKFDESGSPLDFGGSAAYINGHEIAGVSYSEGIAQAAVDSNSHVFYVTGPNSVRAFEANGEPHMFTALEGETSELPAAGLRGVAVDASGNIYASDLANEVIRIYKPSGEMLTEFEPLGNQLSPIGPGNLAVDASGTIYATDVNHGTTSAYAFEPSIYPVSNKTVYGLGQPLDANPSFSVAVDPATQFVYVGQPCPTESCDFQVRVYNEQGGFVDVIGAEGPGALEGVPVGLGVSEGSKRAYVAVRGESGTALSQVSVFEALSRFVGPPSILGASVTNVASSSAVLRARINPNTLETTYWFEYGLEDCAVSPGACTKVPSSGASIGSGHNPVPVSADLSGLTPGTKYFFRVVAENSDPASPEATATRIFTTQVAQFGSRLGDERVWELVTPTKKFGGVTTNAGPVQADADGSGIAFQTRGSIVEDPEGNRALEASAVLARRSGSGWGVSDLVPPHTEASPANFGWEYKLFSEHLEQALLEPKDNTPLSPEASERTPYLRTNTKPSSYRPLVTPANVPAGTAFGGELTAGRNPISISGADPSLTHVVISSEVPLIAGADERSLYMWSDGTLEPVSELPPENPGEDGKIVTAQVGSAAVSVLRAVSNDGSRVFWSPGGTEAVSHDWEALYLRDTEAEESFRVDVPEEGVSGPGDAHPVFMGASADGSVVFFTDSQQMTGDASPEGRDLYRCEIGEGIGGGLGCTDIQDLTAPLEGSGESGEARDLSLGMSEDGDSVYFVADAVLDTQPNGQGDDAVAGGPNLYLWKQGQGTRFIALLSPEDRSNWGTTPTLPIGHQARVAASGSPSGRYLTFMSERNLTGGENSDPSTGEPVEQAFLYDAVEDGLVCVSCNFSGATEAGFELVADKSEKGVISPDPSELWSGRLVGATLPEASELENTIGFTFYRPRAVLDNGRVFFNSASSLVTGDSNGIWDAYQYEPLGLGTCSQSAGTGTVAVGEEGCVGLVSSGTNARPSVFMDASVTGDDAFFVTFARLSPLDTDNIVDVYDARVDGVEVVVEPPPAPCVGEACQPGGSPPGDATPNSATFNGAGNVKQKPKKHCKKGQRKVKRHGKTKCVKAKKHKKQGKNARTPREGVR